MANVKVESVRFEQYHDDTLLGIETAAPRLSWSLAGTAENWRQTAYEVEISWPGAGGVPAVERVRVADTADSLFRPWPSAPLRSRETASVRLRVSGCSGGQEPTTTTTTTTDWSPWQQVEAGLLRRADWCGAQFVGAAARTPAGQPHRPVLFRSPVFGTPAAAASTGGSGSGSGSGSGTGTDAARLRARLYITALGVYEAHVNGRRVGDREMAPGWTSYRHRLAYQTFDVTAQLDWAGGNVLAVEVAEGWYAGRLTWKESMRNLYGDRLGVLAALEIQTPDGSVVQRLVSDASWGTHPSSLVTSEIYHGEVLDLRAALAGDWTSPRFDQHGGGGGDWCSAAVLDFAWDKVALIAPDVPPVRVTQKVAAQRVFPSKTGKTLVDFGQNLVGKVQIRPTLRAQAAGEVLTLRHAEVLEEGELGIRPLRSAKAQDTILFAGPGSTLSNWTPRFTFHGFRYAEVTGWPLSTPPTADDFVALVVHSDMKRTGTFHCSNELVNQLHANVVWAMRGNFLSVPTDCPQRDERLGWTGDIQAFGPTASFLYASAGLLTSWLQDLAADQQDAGGIVPLVVPAVVPAVDGDAAVLPVAPQAVWDDVAIILPWVLYQHAGDAALLRRQLPSMQAHLRSIPRDDAGLLWDRSLWQLGDWLDPTAPPSEPGAARTDGTLVADAYLVHVHALMARICAALADADADADADAAPHELAATYERATTGLRAAFQAAYVAPSGLLVGDTQTGLALALAFGLHAAEAQARAAGARLARLVRAARFRVATGFAGTPVVLHALSRAGEHALAYRMLLETACPSWLYPVTMGATTVWERWDSMLPDGRVHPGEMTSFNHYALGAVAHWLHEVAGGLAPLAPGWTRFRAGPVPGGDLTRVEVAYRSPCGHIAVEWELLDEGARFVMKIDVPPNTEALVVLPGQSGDAEGRWVGSGRHAFDVAYQATEEWPPKASSALL